MFLNIFYSLCQKKGVSPNKALVDCEISRTLVAKWKKGAVPNGTTLAKLAEYFGVSTDYLMGFTPESQIIATEYKLRSLRAALDFADDHDNDQEQLEQEIEDLEKTYKDLCAAKDSKEKAPALTEKDKRDIARDLEKIMDALDTAGDLQFDGDPMSDEARESIRAAMKLGLEAAKVKNKARFTPRKYRKE